MFSNTCFRKCASQSSVFTRQLHSAERSLFLNTHTFGEPAQFVYIPFLKTGKNLYNLHIVQQKKPSTSKQSTFFAK